MIMLTLQYASPESKTEGEWAGREQVGCGSHPDRGRVEDAGSVDETSVLQVHDQSRQRCVLGQGCKRVTQLSHGMGAGAMFQDGEKWEEERVWGKEEKLACLPYCPPDSNSLRGSVQGRGTHA